MSVNAVYNSYPCSVVIEAHVASILRSLTANLTITKHSDWEQFIQRLNHLVQNGRVRRISAMKRLRVDDEEWYLDPETDEVYVYGPPDWPFLPTWEKLEPDQKTAPPDHINE